MHFTQIYFQGVNDYPSGSPLYFTVFAENSEGTRASVSCQLSTYDTTPPSGRVTAEFITTSNPTVIKASVVAHDDSVVIAAFVGVGFGKGSYGDQMAQWTATDLTPRKTDVDLGGL